MVGNTGKGKSSFVKYLTKNESIVVSDSSSSMTEKCKIYHDYPKFKIIDTPGINDTKQE